MRLRVHLELKYKEILIYRRPDGSTPFEGWLNKLRDLQGRAIIRKRLNRVRLGNLGDSKSVGKGVRELRVNFGPGYRIYFGEHQNNVIVLLCAGDKVTQVDDIRLAQEYWSDFLLR